MLANMNLPIACLCILFMLFVSCQNSLNDWKVCHGTRRGMSEPVSLERHYENMRQQYHNCTHVVGNLELTWLEDEDLDVSFLEGIREVRGYVLIADFGAKRIVLPNLRAIRGQMLFSIPDHNEEYALFVTQSGMDSLELPSLREISAGSVGFIDNYNLCHMKSIDWTNILRGPDAQFTYLNDFNTTGRTCPPCDNSCQKGCWGQEPEMCQQFTES